MRSPLSHILAEVYMNNFENEIINKAKYKNNIKI